MMNYEYLHEAEHVELVSLMPQPVSALLPVFEELGFTLHDDVVSFDRAGRIPPWQHSSVVEVEVLYNGEEIFGFDDGAWDVVRLKYLFATLPYELTETFFDLVFAVSARLSTSVRFEGISVDETSLRESFARIRDELIAETGEDAGSERLAIMIHRTYPRR